MLTKEAIVQLLATDDRALCRALVLLNERQTADEQASEATRYHNGRGFRPCHARMGTSMANFFTRRGYLSPKQLAYWRKPMKCGNMRIGIYSAQLLEEAKLKQERRQIALDAEKRQLEIALGEIMDSDDDTLIAAAQRELDEYMERVRGKSGK
jgi:hypothetical protein